MKKSIFINTWLVVAGLAFKSPKFRSEKKYSRNFACDHVSMVTSADWNERDWLWKNDANKIEFVESDSMKFASLEEIGLNTTNIGRTSIIPHHTAKASDLFCNRELNINHIEAIGFDMDFTLAQYTEEFDLLAYNGAKQKLVSHLCYPVEVLSFEYKQSMNRRGCIIDKKRGNILKVDRHRYVRVALHGLTPLSREERKSLYKLSHKEILDMNGPGYANIDTPFSLVDATLYSQIVDLKDRLGLSNELLAGRSYLDLWNDIRSCVDKCHNDGVIKLTVAQNPEKYIVYDPNIFPMLQAFREAGRKIFLLTNSLWDYTQVVMNYLEGRKTGESKDLKWAESFDIIIVGGNKPAFLIDDKMPLYRLNPLSHSLENVDDVPSTSNAVKEFLRKGKFFQSGNARMLHKLLQIKSGEQLLYVGDHVYSDVVRSKRSLGWRTCLIIPELTEEILTNEKQAPERRNLAKLRNRQFQLENTLDRLLQHEWLLKRSLSSTTNEEIRALHKDIHVLQEDLASLRLEILTRLSVLNEAYTPHWGPLFKAGFQESRFAIQVMDFACVYTSRASNLGLVSPQRPFRPNADRLPHDTIFEEEL